MQKKKRALAFREGLKMGLPYFLAQKYAKFRINGDSCAFLSALVANGAVKLSSSKLFSFADNEWYHRDTYSINGVTVVYSELSGITIF